MKQLLGSVSGACAIVAGLSVMGARPAEAACVGDPYMGTVCWTMAFYCPDGYAEANGSMLPIASFQPLFSLLGTNFGGDGRVTFALPDLRGRSAVGVGTGPGLSAVALGKKLGREEYMLSIDELPSHAHTARASYLQSTGTVLADSGIGTEVSPSGNSVAARLSSGPPRKRAPYYGAASDGGVMASGAVDVTLDPTHIQTSKAGMADQELSAIPLRPPQATVRACIAVKGTYPPRDN